MTTTKVKRGKSVTQILTGALKLFGKDGERWNNVDLVSENKAGQKSYCAIGAISKIATGYGAQYIDDIYDNGNAKIAAKLVAKFACHSKKNRSDVDEFIPMWNDSRQSGKKGYVQVKKAFCKAVKESMKPGVVKSLRKEIAEAANGD